MCAGDSMVSETSSLQRVDGQVNRENSHVVQKWKGRPEEPLLLPRLEKEDDVLAKP